MFDFKWRPDIELTTWCFNKFETVDFCISLASLIIVFLVTCWMLIHFFGNCKEEHFIDIRIRINTIIVLVFYLLAAIARLVADIDCLDPQNSDSDSDSQNSDSHSHGTRLSLGARLTCIYVYTFSFVFLMLLFIIRLKLTFTNSVYSMKENVWHGFVFGYILLTLLWIAFVILAIMDIEYYWYEIVTIIYGISIIYVLITLKTLHLFITTLGKLAASECEVAARRRRSTNKTASSITVSDLDQSQISLIKLMSRYTLLICIALISSILTMGVLGISVETGDIFTHWGYFNWITIDLCVNLSCVVLQTPFAENVYYCICFHCDKICLSCFEHRTKEQVRISRIMAKIQDINNTSPNMTATQSRSPVSVASGPIV